MAKKNKELAKTTSCGALTWRLNRDKLIEVLLIKQFAHKESWGIPKGHTNEGEAIEDCALREVREETGIPVKLGHRMYDVTIELKNEVKTVVTYIAQPVDFLDNEPKIDDPDSEVADARWFSVEELPKIVAYQQKLVQDAIAHIKAAFEEHDKTVGLFNE